MTRPDACYYDYKMSDFGYQTLRTVSQYLDADAAARWMGRMSLSERVILLATVGAPGWVIDEINARYHRHTGPVEEFDFDETTAVEMPAELVDEITNPRGRLK